MTFSLHPLNERQERIVALAGELADTFARRADQSEWTGQFPYENYRDLHEAGYLSLTVPADSGGWGADILDVVLGQARLAQGCPSTALVTTMHLVNIGKITAGREREEALFARICRAVVEEGAMINTAASEPSTGSPSRGGLPSTTARRQTDGSWVIDGRKTYTTGSPVLRYFLVSCALVDEAAATSDLPPLESTRGNFLVERELEGVRIEETWNSLSMRLSGSHDLVLEHVHVGAEAHTGLLDASKAAQAIWGLPVAAVYLGISQGARNQAVKFARSRRPNSLNQSIASVPHIQEKVAQMDLALLQSETVLFAVADQCRRDPAHVLDSQLAAAKYLATNHGAEVVDLAMRLVGGAALSLNLPFQRYYRDIRAGFNNPPMDDVTITLLSKQALETE